MQPILCGKDVPLDHLVTQGQVLTSAGAAAALDLCLHMVRTGDRDVRLQPALLSTPTKRPLPATRLRAQLPKDVAGVRIPDRSVAQAAADLRPQSVFKYADHSVSTSERVRAIQKLWSGHEPLRVRARMSDAILLP